MDTTARGMLNRCVLSRRDFINVYNSVVFREAVFLTTNNVTLLRYINYVFDGNALIIKTTENYCKLFFRAGFTLRFAYNHRFAFCMFCEL